MIGRRLAAVFVAFLLSITALWAVAAPLPAHAAAKPMVASVTPALGKVAGGVRVTVTGSGFTKVTKVLFGKKAGKKLRVVSDTQLSVIAPSGKAGYVDVRVVTKAGTSAKGTADRFRYVPAPKISKLSVTSGATVGGVSVKLTGSSFVGVKKVLFGSTAGTGLKVSSERSLTVTAPAHAVGKVSVKVVSAFGTSAKRKFTYQVRKPVITAVTPRTGSTAGGTTIMITGSVLTATRRVTFGGVPATGVKVASDSGLTAVTPAHAVGVVDVAVTGPGGTAVRTGAFTYTPAPVPAPPTITTIEPDHGTTAGGTKLTITGTHLAGTLFVKIGGVEATNPTAVSETQVTAITPAHAAGGVDVVLAAPGGTVTKANGFAYETPAPAAPKITMLTPSTGPTTGGTTVTITGTNLTGATKVTVGGVDATSFTVDSDTQVTASTPAHTAGQVDVSLTTPGGIVTKVAAYTYVAPVPPAPTIDSISPHSGPVAGGTRVTIAGANLAGTTGVMVGGVAATDVSVDSATQVRVTTPAHAAGVVDVVLTAPGGTVTKTAAYTYIAAPLVGTVRVAGTPQVFESLTATLEGWPEGTEFTYEWIHPDDPNDPIAGATGPSFELSETDEDQEFAVRVTASLDGFSPVTVTSEPVGPVVRITSSLELNLAITRDGVPVSGSDSLNTSSLVGVGIVAKNGDGGGDFTEDIRNGGTIWSAQYDPGRAKGAERLVVCIAGPSSVPGYTWHGPVLTDQHGTVFTPDAIPSDWGSAGGLTLDFCRNTTMILLPDTLSADTVLTATWDLASPPAPSITGIAPATGPVVGGTRVTIAGANLAGTTGVMVGGVAATDVSVDSATQVRVTTPAHAAGVVDVVLTAPGGTVTKTAAYTYTYATPGCAQSVQHIAGGTIGTDTTWTCATAYLVDGSLTVSSGATLTIEAGTVVKFASGGGLTVGGSFLVNGTSDRPVTMTGSRDDSVLGDTNGDGTTTMPAGGDWEGVNADNAATLRVDHAVVRYATFGITSSAVSTTVRDSLFYNTSATGIRLYGPSVDLSHIGGLATPVVTGNTIDSESSWPSIDISDDSQHLDVRTDNLANNIASGTGGNYMRLSYWTLRTDQTWDFGSNAMPVVAYREVNVPSGTALTVPAGTIIKFGVDNLAGLNVAGSLLVDGASDAPVILTSLRDDSVLGDTNGDRATSTPVAGNWEGIHVTDGGIFQMDHAEVRYADTGVKSSAASTTVRDSLFYQTECRGIYLYLPHGDPTAADGLGTAIITNNTINIHGSTCAAIDVYDYYEALNLSTEDLVNNVAAGTGGNYMKLYSWKLRGDETWGFGGDAMPVIVAGQLTVPAGITLALPAGTTIKFNADRSTRINVYGTLLMNGTSDSPVILTSSLDDSVLGDTMNDGASVPSAADWYGIVVNGGTIQRDHAEVRYASTGT
jgi:hypothetical protein